VPERRGWRALAVLVVAAFAFLPLVNWIPGGLAADWYPAVASTWVSGTAIVLGLGTVMAVLSRSLPSLWREGGFSGAIGWWEGRPVAAPLALAGLALVAYLTVAVMIFSARPLHVDELALITQARIFAGGALYLPAPAHPEFTSGLHIIDWGGKLYGQFPAGGPAMLALGSLLHAEWIVGPVAGAVGVFLFARLARLVAPTPGAALGSTLLYAFAPFALFMSGTAMNHVTTLAWLVAGLLALAVVTSSPSPRPLAGFLGGVALGIAGTIRPVDAFAFALPASIWCLARALDDRSRWTETLAAGAGVALPLLALMWVNLETTGAPLRFGYTVMWGPAHGLGFHTAPWGAVHTPLRGLELTSLYLLRLQTFLFESPLPSLLPALLALLFVPRTSSFDRYLLWAGSLLLACYFAYWHDGYYLGPRFLYPLLPLLALWTSRAVVLVREWSRGGMAWRVAAWSGIVALVLAVAMGIPVRAGQYRVGMLPMRWNVERAARAAGVRDALVLVRESWGAQLLARLWAAGVTRSDAEGFYRTTDDCSLETTLGAVESGTLPADSLPGRLRTLMADSLKVVRSPFTTDPTARILPGTIYSPVCQDRLRDDQDGYTLLAPLLLARDGNVYRRDLHARDTLLLAEYPGRPVYLLRPATSAQGEEPKFYPISRDSLYAAWAGDTRHSSSGSARQ
jgi:hypothetical protein